MIFSYRYTVGEFIWIIFMDEKKYFYLGIGIKDKKDKKEKVT